MNYKHPNQDGERGTRRRAPKCAHVVLPIAMTLAACNRTEPPARIEDRIRVPDIERFDSSLDGMVPLGATVERLADGFNGTEGPVWIPDGGYLLFTDNGVPVLHKWSSKDGVTTFLQGPDLDRTNPSSGGQPGGSIGSLRPGGDERFLYVSNSNEVRKIWMRWELKPDGSVGAGSVFYDASNADGEGVPDGMKIDKRGNLFATGPGGIWIISPGGKALGRIHVPETAVNCAWGDADGKTLYITATKGLYRVKLAVEGVRPGTNPVTTPGAGEK